MTKEDALNGFGGGRNFQNGHGSGVLRHETVKDAGYGLPEYIVEGSPMQRYLKAWKEIQKDYCVCITNDGKKVWINKELIGPFRPRDTYALPVLLNLRYELLWDDVADPVIIAY